MTELTEALGAPRVGPGKILTIDIERLPGTAEVFDARVDYIRPGQWVEPPRTICWAARWYGETSPIFEAEWIDAATMVEHSWELYDEAEAVVTFNGVRFDNKHLKSMWFEYGLPMPSPWKDIDLYPTVKQFGYVSSSLDYVTKKLGRPGKVDKYEVEVARAAVNGDPAAQARIMRYNIGDVEVTEWLYDRLRGWMPRHPFVGPAAGLERVCNQCGSHDLAHIKDGYRAAVIDYERYRCNDCGANLRGGWHSRVAGSRGI